MTVVTNSREISGNNHFHYRKTCQLMLQIIAILKKFQDNFLAISYNSQGIPSVDELRTMLESYKSSVTLHKRPQQYVLSPQKKTEEILLIGEK